MEYLKEKHVVYFSSAPTGSSLVWSALWARIVVFLWKNRVKSDRIWCQDDTSCDLDIIFASGPLICSSNQPFQLLHEYAWTFLVPGAWYNCHILMWLYHLFRQACVVINVDWNLDRQSTEGIPTSTLHHITTTISNMIELIERRNTMSFRFSSLGSLVVENFFSILRAKNPVFSVGESARLHAPIPNHANPVWKHWFVFLGTKDPTWKKLLWYWHCVSKLKKNGSKTAYTSIAPCFNSLNQSRISQQRLETPSMSLLMDAQSQGMTKDGHKMFS